MKQNYGERICLACEKTFSPAYAAQVTCSKKCWKERKKKLWKAENARRRERHKKYVADLELKVKSLEQELNELVRKLEAAESTNKADREHVSELEQKIVSLKNEKEKLKKDISSVEMTMKELEDKNSELKKSFDDQKEECERLVSEISSKKDHSLIQHERDEFKQLYEDQKKKCEHLTQENADLLDEIGRIIDENNTEEKKSASKNNIKDDNCKRCGKSKAIPGKSLCKECTKVLSA